MVIFKSNVESKVPPISYFFLLTLFLIYIPSSLAIRPNYDLSGHFSLKPINSTIFTHNSGGVNGVRMVKLFRPGTEFEKGRVIGEHPIKPPLFTNKKSGANDVGMVRTANGFGKAHAIGEQHLQPIKPTVFNNKNDHAKGVGMARSKNGFGKSRVIIEQQLQPIKPRVFTNKNGGANGVGRVRPRNGFGKGCFIGKQQQHRSIQSNKLTILTHNSGVVIGKDDHPMHVRPSVVMHNYHAAESGLNRLFGSDSGNTKEGRNGVVGERHLTDHVQPTSGNDFELNKFFGPGSKFGKRWGKGGVAGDRYRGKPEQQQSEMSSVRRKTRQADPSVSPPDGVGK